MGGTGSVESIGLPRYVPLPHDSPNWVNMGKVSRNIKNFSHLLPVLRILSEREDLDFEGLEYSINCYGSERFYQKILPFMINLLFDTPKLLGGLKLEFLPQFKARKVVLDRKVVCVLLVNAFFSTFSFLRELESTNQRSTMNRYGLNEINFDGLFNCPGNYNPTNAKICMLIHYFDRCSEEIPKGNITIERKVLMYMETFSKPGFVHDEEGKSFNEDIIKKDSPFSKVFVHPKGSLRSMKNCRIADFANKYIGGGVLETGCVQEEIMFCENPECLISLLLCPCMFAHEAIVIYGTEQFSKHEGYGKSLKYGGDYKDGANVGKYEITAFDAEDYRFKDQTQQFSSDQFLRELIKSFVAFEGGDKDISTGNWGCGAFRGDHRLKFVIQWISASLHGKDLHYFTFEGEHPILAKEIELFVKSMKDNNRRVLDIVEQFNRLESVLPTLGPNFMENSFLEILEKMFSGNL